MIGWSAPFEAHEEGASSKLSVLEAVWKLTDAFRAGRRAGWVNDG